MREADAELDLAIAEHVRVWCAACSMLGEEVVEYTLPILGREVDPMQRDAKFAADGASVLVILGHGAVAVVLFPVRHEEALNLMTSLHEQQGGHRRVDTARQTDDDSHA